MFNILIAESDKYLRQRICDYLEENVYKTFPASDGSEALAMINMESVNFLVCGMMPDIDGYTLIKAIRKTNSHLPIIMISTRNSIEDMQKGFESGADGYMIQPFELKELKLRIQSFLRRS